MAKLPAFLRLDPIRYRAFVVSFHSATEHSSARIRIKDVWHNKSATINWNSTTGDDALDRAAQFLNWLGFEIKGQVATKSDQYDTLLCTEFQGDISDAKKAWIKRCKVEKSQRILQNGHLWSSKKLPNMQDQAPTK